MSGSDTVLLEKLTDSMLEMVQSGRVNDIPQLLTEDTVFLPPDSTSVVGREGYLGWVSAFQTSFEVRGTAWTKGWDLGNRWAFQWGEFTDAYYPRSGGAPIGFNGKFLRAFEKGDRETWRIARVAWNSNHAVVAGTSSESSQSARATSSGHAASSASPPKSDAAARDVAVVSARMSRLVEAGDVFEILSLLGEGLVFMPDGSPPLVGKSAYFNWASSFQAQFAVNIRIVSHEIVVDGDHAFERGEVHEKYTSRTNGGVSTFDGKFLRTFRKNSSGDWLIVWALWNGVP